MKKLFTLLVSAALATVCGAACEHKNVHAVAEKEPTCTEWGWYACNECDDCGAHIQTSGAYSPMRPPIHKYFDAGVETVPGVKTYTCSACHAELTSNVSGAKKIPLKSGDKIIFFGDSITAYGWQKDTGYCKRTIEVLGRLGLTVAGQGEGVIGDMSSTALARLQKDAAKILVKQATGETYFTYLIGVNDASPYHAGHPTAEQYMANVDATLDMVVKAGITPVVIIFPGTVDDYPTGQNSQKANFSEQVPLVVALRNYAAEKGYPIVEAFDPIHEATQEYGSGSTSGDGVHMSTLGDALLAKCIIEATSLEPRAILPVATQEALPYTRLKQTGVLPYPWSDLSGDMFKKDVGTYTVTATLADGAAWADGETATRRDITWKIGAVKTANEWTTPASITKSTWALEEDPGVITAPVAKFGAATMVPTLNGAAWDGTTLPTAAGSYIVTWTVPESDDYLGLTTSLSFTITGAPETYTFYDWIDSSATRTSASAGPALVIDGFALQGDYKIETKVSLYDYDHSLEKDYYTVFCARTEATSGTTPKAAQALFALNTQWRYDYYQAGTADTAHLVSSGSDLEIVANGNVLTVNGTRIASPDALTTKSSGAPLMLFAANNSKTMGSTPASNFAKMRMYSFTVKSADGTTLLDLVPAKRDSDQVAGMYDRKGGNFYASATAQAFVVGNSEGGDEPEPPEEPEDPTLGANELRLGAATAAKVKPLGGVNSGPKVGYGVYAEAKTFDGQTGPVPYIDATDLYSQLAPPYVRLHDVEFPFGHNRFIDVHCYLDDTSEGHARYFADNDAYVDSILAASPKAKIIFRLGESIAFTPKINPYAVKPSDYDEWSQAACEIAEHYIAKYPNVPWYFEVWNEPEVSQGREFAKAPNVDPNAQSIHSAAPYSDYVALYKVAAKALGGIRAKYPNSTVKVGPAGFAGGGSGSDKLQSILTAIGGDAAIPLDFIDDHHYATNPNDITAVATTDRGILDANGRQDVELILGEWNVFAEYEGHGSGTGTDKFARWSGSYGGSYVLRHLIAYQNCSAIDAATFYDAQFSGYWNILWYKPYQTFCDVQMTEGYEGSDWWNIYIAAQTAVFSKYGPTDYSEVTSEKLATFNDAWLAEYDKSFARILNAYDQTNESFSVFDAPRPLTGFYAMKFFRRLYELGNVATLDRGVSVSANLSALAATDGKGHAALAIVAGGAGWKGNVSAPAGGYTSVRITTAQGGEGFEEVAYTVGDATVYDGGTVALSLGKYQIALVEFETADTPVEPDPPEKPTPVISGSITMAGWTEGETASEPTGLTSDKGTIVYKYYSNANCTAALGSKPTTAGTYWVRGEIAATADWNAAVSAAVSFTIAEKQGGDEPEPPVVESGFLANLCADARKIDGNASPYATGGDLVLKDGDDYIHVFYNTAAAGTLSVTGAATADILVVGGGACGGSIAHTSSIDSGAGGGGAGGVTILSATALAAGSYAVTVGAGGKWADAKGTYANGNGGTSSFGELATAHGGGIGARYKVVANGSVDVACGGGGNGYYNDPKYSAGGATAYSDEGCAGGDSPNNSSNKKAGGGGGGGAGAVGGTGVVNGAGGAGGDGKPCAILGGEFSEQYFGGGGGGASVPGVEGAAGGLGGGGKAGTAAGAKWTESCVGEAGENGLGGGGGAGCGVSGSSISDEQWASQPSGDGGSGIVIVRIKGSGGPVSPKVIVDGQELDFNQATVDAVRAGETMTFGSAPAVDGQTITFGGTSVTVADYYDIHVEGSTVTLAITADEERNGSKIAEVGMADGAAETFTISLPNMKKGLWYAAKYAEDLDFADFKVTSPRIPGDGESKALSIPCEGATQFHRVVIFDTAE